MISFILYIVLYRYSSILKTNFHFISLELFIYSIYLPFFTIITGRFIGHLIYTLYEIKISKWIYTNQINSFFKLFFLIYILFMTPFIIITIFQCLEIGFGIELDISSSIIFKLFSTSYANIIIIIADLSKKIVFLLGIASLFLELNTQSHRIQYTRR